jgi:hypothetical protein
MGGQSTKPNIIKKTYHLRVQKYRDLAMMDPKAMNKA